ncbi:unnamed protein product, partial [Gulo gulo]
MMLVPAPASKPAGTHRQLAAGMCQGWKAVCLPVPLPRSWMKSHRDVSTWRTVWSPWFWSPQSLLATRPCLPVRSCP